MNDLVRLSDVKIGMTVLLPKRGLHRVPHGMVTGPEVDRSVVEPFTVQGTFRDAGGVLLVGTIPNGYEGWPGHLVTFYSSMTQEPYRKVEA